MTFDEIAGYRQDTPALSNSQPDSTSLVHLDNAGAALSPRPVLTAIQDHLLLESEVGGYPAARLHSDRQEAFYTAVAEMLNTQPQHIAFATSATDAYNRALTSIDWQRDDVLLTTTDDYVSNQIAFLQLRDRFGIRVVRAEDLPEGGVAVDDLRRKMDELRPRLVAVTHIPTNSGLIQPISDVGTLCRERETLYLVDACQSAGQLPLDVEEIGCDFLTATFRKFMRGPRGTGFLYVSDRVLAHSGSPLVLDLHSARWTASETYAPVADAKRFELWERSHALLHGAAAATRYATNIGLDRIAIRVQALATDLRTQLRTLPGVRVLDKGAHLGGIVTFALADGREEDLQAYLFEHRITSSISYGDYARLDAARKGVARFFRLSPHYYNTGAELAQAVSVVQAFVEA